MVKERQIWNNNDQYTVCNTFSTIKSPNGLSLVGLDC